MNAPKNKPKSKRVTWTFQPDADLIPKVKALLGPNPKRGDLTKLVNLAIQLHGPDAAKILKLLRDLQGKGEGKG